MSIEDIKVKLTQIFVEELGVQESEVTDKAELSDLGADSLDAVELVMAVEEDFELEISDEDAEKLVNLQAFAEYIEKRL